MVKTPSRKRKVCNEDEEEDESVSRENGGATPPAAQVPGASAPASRLRSRKRNRRDSGDESSGIYTSTDDDEDEDTSTKPPPAKRRSTRRKKKTSNDDNDVSMTTTTDDDEQDGKRRASNKTTRKSKQEKVVIGENNDSSDDDESMTEEKESEEDESRAQKKKKARGQNGYKPSQSAAAASLPTVQEEEQNASHTPTNGTAAATARLEPISKLRMPSQHTPGKLQETAILPGRSSRRRGGDILDQVPPFVAGGRSTTTTQQQQQQQLETTSPQGVDNQELQAILNQSAAGTSGGSEQQQQQVSMTAASSWYQTATMSLETMVHSVVEITTSLVTLFQQDDLVEGEEQEVEQVDASPSLLTKPLVWFLFLLVVQLVCWNPVVRTVEETSERSLGFYKSLFGQRQQDEIATIIKEETPSAVNESSADDTANEAIWNELDNLAQTLESMEKAGNAVDRQVDFVQQEMLEIRGRMRERQQALDDWKDGLHDVESAMYGLGSAESMDDVPPLFFRANEILGFFKDMVPPKITTDILDTTHVFLWETESDGAAACEQEKKETNDALLTTEKLNMAKKELREMSSASAAAIMANEQVQTALRAWIRNALPPMNATSLSKEEVEPLKGLTQDMALGLISDLVEKQQADQLGIVDYASISAGASVIIRATSPSLVDSLPLWNRLMEHAGLRFYGYGPQAALTPTFPVTALGQCWAFEKDSRRLKNGGKYATLTVRLSKPIYVNSVVVEHASKEVTDQVESAIRGFRVFGYEDGDAVEEPWNLGSFEYDIDAPKALQQFEVANYVDGELLPKLRSISLAIDSNWGFSYSCLYRFRVFGDDKPSDRVIEVTYEEEFEEELLDDVVDEDSYIEEEIDDESFDDEIDYEGHHVAPEEPEEKPAELEEHPDAHDEELEEQYQPDTEESDYAESFEDKHLHDTEDSGSQGEEDEGPTEQEEASESETIDSSEGQTASDGDGIDGSDAVDNNDGDVPEDDASAFGEEIDTVDEGMNDTDDAIDERERDSDVPVDNGNDQDDEASLNDIDDPDDEQTEDERRLDQTEEHPHQDEEAKLDESLEHDTSGVSDGSAASGDVDDTQENAEDIHVNDEPDSGEPESVDEEHDAVGEELDDDSGDEDTEYDGMEDRYEDEEEEVHRWDRDDQDSGDANEDDSSDDESYEEYDEETGERIRVEYRDGIRYEYHLSSGDDDSGDEDDSGDDSRDDE